MATPDPDIAPLEPRPFGTPTFKSDTGVRPPLALQEAALAVHPFPAASAPTLVTTWYGVFAVGPDGIIGKRLFKQDAATIADRLHQIRNGAVLEEEEALLRSEAVAGLGQPLVVLDRRLRAHGELVPLQGLVPTGFDHRASGYTPTLLRDALLRLTIHEARAHMSERDRLIVQEVRALDEIIRSVNLLAERLREWYAIHAPEIVGHVRQHKDLARLISMHGDRASVTAAVEGLAPDELGVDLPEADEQIVRAFAVGLEALYGTWERIESRLVDAMGEVAPTLSRVAGPMLGARLISQAGGLEALALAPSGTVQTLGAENALFRHLKDGSPPPKHGMLFQHESINRAPWWQRGKISRALAGKISIAAKGDAFGTTPERGDELVAAFENRLDHIRRQYPRPPDRAFRRPVHGKGRPGRKPDRDTDTRHKPDRETDRAPPKSTRDGTETATKADQPRGDRHPPAKGGDAKRKTDKPSKPTTEPKANKTSGDQRPPAKRNDARQDARPAPKGGGRGRGRGPRGGNDR